jgi:Amt family ammonium transporter
LDQAISFAKQSEESLSFSVNVSPKQFKDVGFADYVEGLLSKANLEPSRLELEITETSLVEDDERAIRVIEQLKEIGVQMSLDDFGTGYSSMSYLAKFPFDRLKIDRAFMSGAIYSAKRRAIVKAMIEVGKALNMRVIAEGVETRDELDFLKAEGCDEAQGFLFGKPALLADAMKNLQHPIAASHRLRSQEEIDRLVDMLRNTHAMAG